MTMATDDMMKAMAASNEYVDHNNDPLAHSIAFLISNMAYWRPIGSAPKDGTEILALCRAPARTGAYYEAVRYLSDAPCWVTREGWMRDPTHWMPLPPEPQP
jgi:hypothetical protein